MSDHSAVPVSFASVWKKFYRGNRHDSLRDVIPAALRALVRRTAEPELGQQEFWALQDVSFEVDAGRALGIIGPNGAGKSTTLKLLTRILRPTRGACVIRGRLGALIEIAAGFHPDLTGRENIYLQGSIMGMTQGEIKRREEEIIDFAGVAKFIDTPVKRYSSGMNARLGFSIAAHLDPDVLVIDEVLSVGDMAFQRKCVERMSAFKARGVAIVFVSHNLQAVAELCDRALYLHSTTQAYGPPGEVVRRYLSSAVSNSSDVSEDRVVTHFALEVVDVAMAEDGEVPTVRPGQRLRLTANIDFQGARVPDVLGLFVHRSADMMLVYDGNFDLRADMSSEHERLVSCEFLFAANLLRGHYVVGLHAYEPASDTFIFRRPTAATFVVSEDQSHGGVADLSVTFAIGERRSAT